MGIVLARVDERLVHGVVVTQVASSVDAKRIMVIDDTVCKNEDQKKIMRMSKPTGTSMSIIDSTTAINNFKEGKYDNHNVLLVVNDPNYLIQLAENCIQIPKITIGILFEKTNRKKFTNNVSLSISEIEQFKFLQDKLGVPVVFQHTPQDKELTLSELVN